MSGFADKDTASDASIFLISVTTLTNTIVMGTRGGPDIFLKDNAVSYDPGTL